MLRIPFEEIHRVLTDALFRIGFETERASLCARLFTQSSCDGVSSHGLNRFPRFIEMIKNGVVDIHAAPELECSFGVVERWNGNRGVGNLNAHQCMDRAIQLSRANGLGCVALANTNHWMRGGSYGWQAAESGVIGICWTNTLPNLPPWGGDKPRLGNNPLVIAVPRAEGHLVLDMAMSQFSYGTLESYRVRGEQLPVAGGFNPEGNMTRDPGEIEQSLRPLPIGFWKGSGLSLMLDLIAALLSGGRAVHNIDFDPLAETGLSQVFIAVNLASIRDAEGRDALVDQAISFIKTSDENARVRYPGERALRVRAENMRLGVPVDEQIWAKVKQM